MSIVLHIPHASKYIPDEYLQYFTLSKKDLEVEILKMTDHFTDELFDVSGPNIHQLKFPISRLLVDVERFEKDELEPMFKVGMGCVYEKTHHGYSLKNVEHIKDKLINKFYREHHENFTEIIDKNLKEKNKVLIIDCHSFPKHPHPYELNQVMDRPEICIGTDNFHTSEKLKTSFGKLFEGLNFTVKYNEPFEGSIVPLKFYNKEVRVQSIMIEVRRDLYMNEQSGEKKYKFYYIKNLLRRLILKINNLN
jgi:N-formylglutamate deformylase